MGKKNESKKMKQTIKKRTGTERRERTTIKEEKGKGEEQASGPMTKGMYATCLSYDIA